MDTRLGDPTTEFADPEPVIAPVPTLPSVSPERSSDKRWHVGTLSYSLGGLVTLFCWLLWGDFAWWLKERSVLQVFQLLLKDFHSPDWLAGLLLGTLPNVLAIGIGPIFAYKSDRYRSRWGRRVPFLLATVPIMALSMVGLAFSPLLGRRCFALLGGPLSASGWVLLSFGLFWTTFEFGTITANIIFAAFANDVVPRPLLGRFYGMFRAIGLIAGMLFGYYLMGHAETHYVPIFLGISAIYAFGFTLMCLKVKEGAYPAPSELPTMQEPITDPPYAKRPSRVRRGLSIISQYLHDCFGNRYYLWAFGAVTVSNMGLLAVNLFNIFFAKSVHMGMDRFGKLQALSYGISLVQALPIGWLADKFHPLRVSMVALVLHGVAAFYGGMGGSTPHVYGIAFVLTTTFSGTYFTATAAINQVLLPRAKFAQFASAMGIVTAVATILLSPALGVLLDHSHHLYRLSYLVGFALDALGLVLTAILYKKFLALGGPLHYVAPE